MTTTTLNRIRSHNPCANGWKKLLEGLGKTQADAEPLALTTILDINGLNDAIWALRCVDDQAQVRRYAVWCARQVQHLMTDSRSLAALDVAERHADGQATDEELASAGAAAWAAAWAAAGAARAARDAARAAWAATGAAAGAARAARDAAWAARYAAWGESSDAAWSASRAAQEAQFRVMFGGDK